MFFGASSKSAQFGRNQSTFDNTKDDFVLGSKNVPELGM